MEDECLLDSAQRLTVTSPEKPWRKRSTRDAAPEVGRISVVSMTSQRGSVTEARRPRSRNTSSVPDKKENTLHFVYSEQVEKAMRSNFRCSAYPPLSRKGAAVCEPSVSIESLQDIYSELVTFRRNRRYNLAREDSWKANNVHRSYMSRRSSMARLPHSVQGGPPSPGKGRFSYKLDVAAQVFAKLREYQNRAAAQDEVLVTYPKKDSITEGACVTKPPALPHAVIQEHLPRITKPTVVADSLLPGLVRDENHVENSNLRSPGLQFQRKTSVFLPPLIVTEGPSSVKGDEEADVFEPNQAYLRP